MQVSIIEVNPNKCCKSKEFTGVNQWKRKDKTFMNKEVVTWKNNNFKCFRCGFKHHNTGETDKYPVFDKTCKKCLKKSHPKSQCKSKLKVKFIAKENPDDNIGKSQNNKDGLNEFAFLF